MRAITLIFIVTLLAGCASSVPARLTDIAHRAAIRGAADAILLECGSLIGNVTAGSVRRQIDDELARRGSAARSTAPDCGP